MSQAAAEAPATYVLATQFHDVVTELVDALDPMHAHLSIELLKYAERIVGNVGAAEAPFARERRQRHYGIAFSAACGCASACDVVADLRLGPEDLSKRANKLLATLARIIRPIAEEGREPRSETEAAILEEMFGGLEDDEPWATTDDDDWEDDDEVL